MLYTPSHAELAQHPKTRKLARLLGVSIPTALGHLHLLWHFGLKFAPDGNLSRFDLDEIADGCLWEGDPLALHNALLQAGWVEEDGERGVCIHDWEEFGGKVVKQKEQGADRQQRWRDRHKTTPTQQANGDVTVTSPSPNALEERRLEEKRIDQRGDVNGAAAPAPPQVAKANAPTPIKPPRAERETRIPPDYPLTDEMRDWARGKFPGLDLDYAHEEFCTYWRGDGGRKVDWHATWQNGMLKAYGRLKQQAAPRYGAQAQADMNSGRHRKFVGA